MDDRGVLAQPLTREGHKRLDPGRVKASRRTASFFRVPKRFGSHAAAQRFARTLRRLSPILDLKLPRGLGVVTAFLIVFSGIAFGVVRGGHVETVIAQLKDARDTTANLAGFRIASIALAGGTEVSREQILSTTGVTGRSSLLFLDAEGARARLKSNPWIKEATILKFYPDQLRIDVTERQAFALWQKDGRVAVIAADGVVVQPFIDPRFSNLPFVVGAGAEKRAAEFLALLDRYPEIRNQLRASVLVGERRWNLRLKNGLDVRLPEAGVDGALATLGWLLRDKQLLTRDIISVDLRLPDRATVRLSAEAAQARTDALKDKKIKRKGDA
jgi:cell division protein FtsQ